MKQYVADAFTDRVFAWKAALFTESEICPEGA